MILYNMASENHINLANYIKGVHSSLRLSTLKLGAEKAWKDHCNNKDVLVNYSQYMQTLAATHWETNSSKENTEATSRIEWAKDFCYEYFINKLFVKYFEKDKDIAIKISIEINFQQSFNFPLKLLDVGSCYNPFQVYDFFDVLAIDLCPANTTVYQCDILEANIRSETVFEDNKVISLKENNFEIVTLCFVLEYLPTSEQRIQTCQKAYDLLKYGGLLIVTTPDSKHVGSNSQLMKCWQYTLAQIGFNRIKYEKLKHMHCMAFRKSLHRHIAERWAILHKSPGLEFGIHIPQDFTINTEPTSSATSIKADVLDFTELPFCDTQ